MASTFFERQSSEIRCSRSPLFETYPSSTSTDGTSGAFSTLNPADLSGFLCILAEVFTNEGTGTLIVDDIDALPAHEQHAT